MPESLAFGPPLVSIDVEDWQQSTWDRTLPVTRRAAENTERMLDILAAANVHATMFVLGKFADSFPQVVRRIHAEGHEVACHGHGHVEIFRQSPAEFRDDVLRAQRTLEDTIGERVVGYRAPDFSIVPTTLWALQTLASLGFGYDSSVYPIRHGRYGIADWPQTPVTARLPDGSSIVEFPIATLRVSSHRLPVGGGGYHRLLPGVVARAAARAVMQRSEFVYYCHPYEIDPLELWQTELRIPLRVKLHQGLGRGRFERRLRRFLEHFGGRTMGEARRRASPPDFDVKKVAHARLQDPSPTNSI